jgi:hypothetical protein
MHFRAFFVLALYALAFVLGPGLHQVLPAGPCTDCAGEREAAPPRHAGESCCGRPCGAAEADPDPLPEEAPLPAEGDHEHCPDHCGVCRVVHGTTEALPALALATAPQSESPAPITEPAPEPRAIALRPRAARAPPVLG